MMPRDSRQSFRGVRCLFVVDGDWEGGSQKGHDFANEWCVGLIAFIECRGGKATVIRENLHDCVPQRGPYSGDYHVIVTNVSRERLERVRDEQSGMHQAKDCGVVYVRTSNPDLTLKPFEDNELISFNKGKGKGKAIGNHVRKGSAIATDNGSSVCKFFHGVQVDKWCTNPASWWAGYGTCTTTRFGFSKVRVCWQRSMMV